MLAAAARPSARLWPPHELSRQAVRMVILLLLSNGSSGWPRAHIVAPPRTAASDAEILLEREETGISFLAPATGPLGPRWYDEGAASEEEEGGGGGGGGGVGHLPACGLEWRAIPLAGWLSGSRHTLAAGVCRGGAGWAVSRHCPALLAALWVVVLAALQEWCSWGGA